MTRAKISQYDATAANNTDVNGVNIAEGCPPSSMNNMGREIMAALKRFQVGSDGDGVTVGGSFVVSGSTTVNTFSTTLLNADNITIDGNTISSTNSNGNIVLAPNGTGDVQVDADTLQVGDSGSDATVQSNGNADLILKTGNSTTGSVTLADGANGSLTVALNGTGQVIVNAGAVGTPTIAPTGDTNTGIFFPAADTIAFAEGGAEAMRIDSSGNVGIGTSSPGTALQLGDGSSGTKKFRIHRGSGTDYTDIWNDTGSTIIDTVGGGNTTFRMSGTERARFTSGGEFYVGTTVNVLVGNTAGINIFNNGQANYSVDGNTVLYVNRKTNDGILIEFRQDNTVEGNISVSGSTVSYNGGNLSRWAQLTTPKDDTPLFKGTVMSNLDEMNEYVDAEGNPVENEQLNKVKVSDVEGDANVAGVFVNWDYDEAHQVDEINMAMTGDMIIRIAQGVTVARGDLLMSAGDGTAMPQGDDIVRSKTIAKVTSTHVTCTYDDGSYCVPCVLMAC